MATRIFDCVLYSGENDALEIRLRELYNMVDKVIIVESNRSFSGAPRDLEWNPNDPRFVVFTEKIRYVVVRDMPDTSDPVIREAHQRNAALSGIPDAAPDDVVIIAHVEEIPRASVLREIAADCDHRVAAVQLALYYFYVDYRNVEGPEGPEYSGAWTIAARRSELDGISPKDLRQSVLNGTGRIRIYEDGGWHFFCLADREGAKRKIAGFSDQKPSSPEPLNRRDVDAVVRRRSDPFDRPGFRWAVVEPKELPLWLVSNRGRMSRLFCPRNRLESTLRRLRGPVRSSARVRGASPPMIICPYVHAHEHAEIRAKFDLDGPGGRRLPFFAWHDTQKVGPERAFELCWKRFPDLDIVIVHSDMAPMPDDRRNCWFDQLVAYRDTIPQAGMLACNLFYPRSNGAPRRVQCAGGTYDAGRIGHLHGEIGQSAINFDLLDQVRDVPWVTFGGVLIRRDVIRACGAFDRRYKWAYVMDVDYCFEARLRGFRLYQTPSFLLHEENRTTGPMMDADRSLRQDMIGNFELFEQKWKPFSALLSARNAE